MSLRIEKINSLIQQYLSQIIAKDLSLKPGIFLSILKVDTSKDMRYTRIFISVFPIKESAYAINTLHKELRRIQTCLYKKMQTKILPKISFSLDESQEKVSQLEELFKKISTE